MINAFQLIARWTHQSGLTPKEMKVAPPHPSLLTARGRMLHQKVTGLKKPRHPSSCPHIPGNHHCRNVPQFLPPLPRGFIMYQPSPKLFSGEENTGVEGFEGFESSQGFLEGWLLGTAAYVALMNTRRAFDANTLNTKCSPSISGGFMTIMITQTTPLAPRGCAHSPSKNQFGRCRDFVKSLVRMLYFP